MFDFKNGMLGVVIIALAIAGALFGSYLAGIETEQVEVTKYDYLADVSGLFEYDQSPQYIEFDPSTNYTGYYSSDSNGYFAKDRVDYNPSTSVNNYKVDEQPEFKGESTETLNSSQGTKPFDSTGISFTNTYGHYPVDHCDTITLSSWIETMNLTSDGSSLIYLTSIGEYEEFTTPINDSEEVPWIMFSTRNMWNLNTVVNPESTYPEGLYVLTVASQQYMTQNNLQPGFEYYENPTYLPYFSCIVDMNSRTATLCYDSFCESPGQFGISLDTVLISFDGDDSNGVVVLDSQTHMMKYKPYNIYLDPNEGVWLKD